MSSFSDFFFGSGPGKVNWKPSYDAPVYENELLNKALLQQAQGGAFAVPSAAEYQLRQGLAAGQHQAQAAAAGMRGVNPGMAARMAMRAQTGLAAQTNQQAALMRAKEAEAARQALIQQAIAGQQYSLGMNQLALQKALAEQRQPSKGFLGYAMQGLGALASGGAFNGLFPWNNKEKNK